MSTSARRSAVGTELPSDSEKRRSEGAERKPKHLGRDGRGTRRERKECQVDEEGEGVRDPVESTDVEGSWVLVVVGRTGWKGFEPAATGHCDA